MSLGLYTYALAGAMAFAETGAGLGLVVPGELAVILSGVAAGRGEVELIPLVALVWAAAACGDLVSFALGRRLGRGFLLAHGHRVRLGPARVERLESHFTRHGGKTIVLGRFVGLVRALAPFLAGASRMPLRRFLPLSVGAAGVWSAACVGLGYLCWNSVDTALSLAKRGSLGIAAVIALGATVAWAVARARRRSAFRGAHVEQPQQRA